MKTRRTNLHNNLIQTIRLSYLKLLIVPIIIILVICFLLIKIPFNDILVPNNIDKLASISVDGNKHSYYTIESKEWLYSGYNNYKDKKVHQYIFYKIEEGICYYLLISPDMIDTDTMTIKKDRVNIAIQERAESFNPFLSSFALDINWNYDDLNEASSSIIFNTASYNVGIYRLLFTFIIVVLLYQIICKTYYILIVLFPTFSSQFGRKHRHTPDTIKSREEFAMLLQAELDNYLYSAQDLYITNHYIINLRPGEINVIPLNKLCFIFEHGNLRKFLWFYMDVTHTIYFLCSNSLKCHFTYSQSNNLDEIIKILKDTIPDLMVGYSTENQLKYMEIIKEKRS